MAAALKRYATGDRDSLDESCTFLLEIKAVKQSQFGRYYHNSDYSWSGFLTARKRVVGFELIGSYRISVAGVG